MKCCETHKAKWELRSTEEFDYYTCRFGCFGDKIPADNSNGYLVANILLGLIVVGSFIITVIHTI